MSFTILAFRQNKCQSPVIILYKMVFTQVVLNEMEDNYRIYTRQLYLKMLHNPSEGP